MFDNIVFCQGDNSTVYAPFNTDGCLIDVQWDSGKVFNFATQTTFSLTVETLYK